MLDMFLKGGPLMWPILACSILALAITIHKGAQYAWAFWRLNRNGRDANPPGFLRPMLDALDAGAGERELELLGTRQVRRLERGLGMLGLITTVSPILGLTGTVTGMIKTFQVISTVTGPVNPSLLANGIWEALITTAAGLLVSLPAHVAWHFLDERMGELTLAMQETLTARMERRSHGI